jgi:thymidylate synthase (FAD)
MKVRLLTKTEGAKGTEYEGKTIDEIIVGIARCSSSREANELFAEPHKLLRHCLNHSHWSVFGEANLGFEITTSRAIGRELLRHWSLAPQELSQRYKSISEFEPIELRMQSKDNRQSSTEEFDPSIINDSLASDEIMSHLNRTKELYARLLEAGVARECARMILPETTETVLIFNGKIRGCL